MTIGIDLDGVLFDSESFYRSYAELFDIKLNREGSHDESELSIEQKYNWSAEEFQQFLDECMQHVTEDAPLKPYAKEVINLLKSRGHRLVIITRQKKA